MLLIGHVTKEGSLAGPARARAPGRLRPPLRGRARAHLPDAPRAQEPLRRDQRDRRVRDAGGRPGRGRRRLGPLRRRGRARRRLGDPLLDGGHPAAAGRGPGSGRPDRDRAAAAHGDRGRPQPPGAGAGGARPATPASTLSAADVFVNVAGGVRVDEPGADLAVALAVASAHSGPAPLESDGRPLACFGEVGLTGELRYVAHADRRVAEARKFGLGRVLAPPPAEGKVKGLEAGRRRSRTRSARRRRGAGALGRRERLAQRRLTSALSELSTRISPANHETVSFLLIINADGDRFHSGDDLQELEARQDPRLLQGPRHRRPGHRAPRGHRQHRPLQDRRPAS